MTAFTCPGCGRTSHNQNDARERYCGACKRWWDDLAREQKLEPNLSQARRYGAQESDR